MFNNKNLVTIISSNEESESEGSYYQVCTLNRYSHHDDGFNFEGCIMQPVAVSVVDPTQAITIRDVPLSEIDTPPPSPTAVPVTSLRKRDTVEKSDTAPVPPPSSPVIQHHTNEPDMSDVSVSSSTTDANIRDIIQKAFPALKRTKHSPSVCRSDFSVTTQGARIVLNLDRSGFTLSHGKIASLGPLYVGLYAKKGTDGITCTVGLSQSKPATKVLKKFIADKIDGLNPNIIYVQGLSSTLVNKVKKMFPQSHGQVLDALDQYVSEATKILMNLKVDVMTKGGT
jgi:hypothetical protein